MENRVSYETGKNVSKKVLLKHKSGSRAEVYLYGAHITSWTKPEFGELLFMSLSTEFQKGKAIRGGVPVIFPQFGGGDLPSHGFARNREWKDVGSGVTDEGDVFLKLELTEDADTLAVWPFKFNFTLEIILNDKLTCVSTVTNKDEKTFSFQEAFHTYFKISDISGVQVKGLEGLNYIDKVNGNKEVIEENENLKFTTAFDRVYQNSPSKVELLDKILKRKFIIEKQNMNCSVLWNPWEGAKAMKDMHENAYIEMICVESGNVIPKIILQPGAVSRSLQVISVVSF